MNNFWDSSVWTLLLIMGSLLTSLLIANILKKTISFLNKSLIPTSVLWLRYRFYCDDIKGIKEEVR